ncbi:MAG: hypothetical protein AAF805_05865 [Planctomycetota bacterium]
MLPCCSLRRRFVCRRLHRRRCVTLAAVVLVGGSLPVAGTARAAVGTLPGVQFEFVEQQTGDPLTRLLFTEASVLDAEQGDRLRRSDLVAVEVLPAFFTAPSVREFMPGAAIPTPDNTFDLFLSPPSGTLDVGLLGASLFSASVDAVYLDTVGGVGAGTGLFGAEPDTVFTVDTSAATTAVTSVTLDFVFGGFGEPDLLVMTSFRLGNPSLVETVTGDWRIVALPVIGLGPDLSGDGQVDAADYTVWRDAEAIGSPTGDADGDGFTDGLDYLVWRDAYGTSVAAVPAPEPTAVALALLGVVALARRR